MNFKATLLGLLASMAVATTAVQAGDYATSTVGVGGYDLVSYQNGKRPIRGNGHFVSVVNGGTYLFSSAANKRAFDETPDKYLPAYGGYCAFGVSVNKKFVGDPEVYRVVNGRLYLNLDANIQDDWLKDVPGKIAVANRNWANIKDASPAEL